MLSKASFSVDEKLLENANVGREHFETKTQFSNVSRLL